MRLLPLLILLALTPLAAAGTIRELVRFEHEGESKLVGLGLVTGLNGTGDSGKEAAVALELAQVYQNLGLPLTPRDLAKAKSAAVVLLSCTIPKEGARANDLFDVTVTVMHSAGSLRGGQLLVAPLKSPLPGDAAVWAFAEGEIVLDDPAHPTRGTVRRGAHVVRDIRMIPPGDEFNLIVKPPFVGGSAATVIAREINQGYYGRADSTLTPVATAIDERTIRVVVPEAERPDRRWFIDAITSYKIDPALLKLPARVIVNQASGSIVLTDNVQISPTAIIDRDLSIIATIPPPAPTPQNPLVERSQGAPLATAAGEREMVRLQDVLNAFKQLNVPVSKQIHILQMLDKAGQLHAQLILD